MAMTSAQKELWKQYVGRKLQKANVDFNNLDSILIWVMEHRSELCDDTAMQVYVDAEKAVELQDQIAAAQALLVANGIN